MKNENSVMAILAAAVGALCSYAAALVVPLAVLLAVMVGDYVSGMAKAWSTGKLCSKTGLRGILKKLGYLALVGVVLLVVTSVVANRFILLPMYAKFAGMEGIIAMADNPSITSLTTLFIYGVIPFNVVKGLALSLVTFLLYKPLSPLLHDR